MTSAVRAKVTKVEKISKSGEKMSFIVIKECVIAHLDANNKPRLPAFGLIMIVCCDMK